MRYSIFDVISDQPALSCGILKDKSHKIMTLQFITHGYIRLEHSDSDPCVEKLTPDSSNGLIFLSRRIDFEAVMLLHSNVITRIQIVSKVLSRDLLNTKLKFLVPLSIIT